MVPGRVLELENPNSSGSYEAPWWTPQPLKQTVFSKYCGAEIPTVLGWEHTEGRLTITHSDKVVLNKKSVAAVDIFADRIRLWNTQGQAAEYDSEWSS